MRETVTALWRVSESDAPRGVARDTIAARAPSERDKRIETERDGHRFVSVAPIQ